MAVSVTVVFKVLIIVSRSVSSLYVMVKCISFPLIRAWKVSRTLGSFNFSRSELSLLCSGSQIVFRRRCKVTINKSWSLPVSAPGKLRVLALFTPDGKRFLTRMSSIWLWCWPCRSRGSLGHHRRFCNQFFHIFPCSPLPSGTWRTPGLSIP